MQQTDSFHTNFDEIYDLLREWQEEGKNSRQARRAWQLALEKLTPYLYYYPKIRFRVDEDICSEFYLYLYDKLEYLLEQALKAESAFAFYLARSLRNYYFEHFEQSSSIDMESSQEDMEWVADPHLPYGVVQHEPAIEDASFVQGHLTQDTQKRITVLLEQEAIVERSMAKLFFGFAFSLQELKSLFREVGREGLHCFLHLYSRQREEVVRESAYRAGLLGELTKVQNWLQQEFNEIHEKRKNNLLKKYYQVHYPISLRDLAECFGRSKSAVHRVIKRLQKNIAGVD